ncbi:hypothetical protein B0H14DRAFT_2636519 [Mycena olivaceomarginata]|nr:hypothetical protein B0H14DRAFT_2636519 [Mycena olivaceomarginata]
MSADKKREAVTGRKRKEQELKYTADIEAGIQNDDFTLKVTKKRRIVKPELRDDSSSNNIGELSRPSRIFISEAAKHSGAYLPPRFKRGSTVTIWVDTFGRSRVGGSKDEWELTGA